MRIIAKYHKLGDISFTSHLDVQRTLQRALRRAKLPLAYSQGFNPHPLTSFCTALATGYTGDAEWFEVVLARELDPIDFTARLNGCLPRGMFTDGAFAAPEGMGTLSKAVRAAEYRVTLHPDRALTRNDLQNALDDLLSREEIIVDKKSKGGMRAVDMRPQILTAKIAGADGSAVPEDGTLPLELDVLGVLTADGGLRVEALCHTLFDSLATDGYAAVHRSALYFTGIPLLPDIAGVLPRK